MNNRKAVAVLALSAAIGLVSVGCSSNSTSSSATSSSSAAPMSAAGSVSAADCTVIKPIATGTIGKLMPLQSMPPAQQTTAMNQYLAQLTTAAASLTSAKGKTDLGGLITTLQQASSPSAATAIFAAINKLTADCP